MLLAIDTGNTNTIFAVFEDGGDKICDWRCKTIPGRTADEYAVWLDPLFAREKLNFKDIQDIIVSSVVPDSNFNIRTLGEKYFDLCPVILGAQKVETGLEIDLEKPDDLGADRIVNSIAAIEKYGAPCIVLDFGTATTFDIINDKAVYCGGAIAPGVNLSVEALYNAAAQLPVINLQRPESVVGRDTVSALQSGLYWGYVAMIEGMIRRFTNEMNFARQPQVIATGGLASLFANDIKEISVIDDNLTLNGLAIIHDRTLAKTRKNKKTA